MNSTNNESALSLKQQFKLWLEKEQKDDEMIAFATIPHILRRFDRRLAIIKGLPGELNLFFYMHQIIFLALHSFY